MTIAQAICPWSPANGFLIANAKITTGMSSRSNCWTQQSRVFGNVPRTQRFLAPPRMFSSVVFPVRVAEPVGKTSMQMPGNRHANATECINRNSRAANRWRSHQGRLHCEHSEQVAGWCRDLVDCSSALEMWRMKQPSDPVGEYVGEHALTPRDRPFAGKTRAASRLQRSKSSEDAAAVGHCRSARFPPTVASIP